MKAVIVVVCMTLFLVGCITISETTTTTIEKIPDTLYCGQDSDCVPSECCHASGAVNKDHAPNCANVMCTMNCEPGTLDCGQGEIKCIANVCTAVMFE